MNKPGTHKPNEIPVTRIAMWSGPRNISTAMMRAWENRADTFVTDEPFYACYLWSTGMDHPGRDEIIASQSTEWTQIANDCNTLIQPDCAVHYQKHMTQHMLPQFELDWLTSLVNVFLIRSPAEVVSSYAKARPDLTATDLGFEQQHRLYQHVVEKIDPDPLVISADSVLQNPADAMKAICDKADIKFDNNMLSWPAGKRESDGVWAPHWYKNVENSTGFATQEKRALKLDPQQLKIAERCQPYYEIMQQHIWKFSEPYYGT